MRVCTTSASVENALETYKEVGRPTISESKEDRFSLSYGFPHDDAKIVHDDGSNARPENMLRYDGAKESRKNKRAMAAFALS